MKNVQKTQPTNFLRQPSVRDNEDPAEPSCLCARDNKTRDPHILCKARFTILFLKLKKSSIVGETKAGRHIKM